MFAIRLATSRSVWLTAPHPDRLLRLDGEPVGGLRQVRTQGRPFCRLRVRHRAGSYRPVSHCVCGCCRHLGGCGVLGFVGGGFECLGKSADGREDCACSVGNDLEVSVSHPAM